MMDPNIFQVLFRKMTRLSKGLIKGFAILIPIVIVIMLLHPNQNISSTSLKINVSEARSRRFGMIFDARTLKERDLGYYPNSIPVDLNTNIPKNTWILVYSGDNRALNAAEALHKLGYVNVRYITESYIKLMPGY